MISCIDLLSIIAKGVVTCTSQDFPQEQNVCKREKREARNHKSLSVTVLKADKSTVYGTNPVLQNQGEQAAM